MGVGLVDLGHDVSFNTSRSMGLSSSDGAKPIGIKCLQDGHVDDDDLLRLFSFEIITPGVIRMSCFLSDVLGLEPLP